MKNNFKERLEKNKIYARKQTGKIVIRGNRKYRKNGISNWKDQQFTNNRR